MRPLLPIAATIATALLLLWWQAEATPPAPAPTTERAAADVDAATGTLAPATGTLADNATAAPTDAATTRDDLAAIDPLAHARTGYRGRVVTFTGAPVAGITVRLLRGSPDLAIVPELDVFARTPVDIELEAARTTTANDGRFRLDGIAPRGLCWLRLQWPDLARAPPALRNGHGTHTPVQRTPAPGEVVDLGDIELKRGAELTGRIVDKEQRPIAGALVRAANLPPLPWALVPVERFSPDDAIVVTAAGRTGVFELPRWFAKVYESLPLASTIARADGTFALYGVDPGNAALAASAPGHTGVLRAGIDVAAASTTDLGDVALADGEEAEVLVTTPEGQPIANADVIVAPLTTGIPVHLGERAGTTDAEGRLLVPGLPRGRALAAARRSADDPWVLGAEGQTDARLAVTLPGKCKLVLDVVDAEGRRAQSVQLQFVAGQADAGLLELAMFGSQRPLALAQRLRTLDDGRLQIDGLDRGSWRVVATAKDCGITALQIELAGDTERTLQLRAARSLRVRVLDGGGAPVAGASIYLQTRGDRQQRLVDVPLHMGTTDGEGTCLVRDVPSAQARVSAAHPLLGQTHAEVANGQSELELRLLAAGSIRGRLTDGGRPPVPGRWLAVLERRFEQTPRGAMPDLPQLALPDLDGNFEFAALQPGKWRVTVQDSATDIGTIAGVFEYMGRRKKVFPWNKADVELHAGEQLEIRLDAMLDAAPYDGPGALVRGVVTIDGAPGAGALVVGTSTPGDRRITSRVDAGGTFDLGHCPAGALRVVVVPQEVADSRLLESLFSHAFARNVTVTDGEAQQLAIAIATGGLRGEVRDPNGRPAADCRIVLFDQGGDQRSSALRMTRTDSAGAFSFAHLPVGTFELRADKEDVGRVVEKGIAIAQGTVNADVAVALQPVARVSGRVAVQALPKQRRGLTLTPVVGGEPVRSGCNEDGVFEVRNVPFGRYRASVQAWGQPQPTAVGELDVTVPTLRDVVLVPQ